MRMRVAEVPSSAEALNTPETVRGPDCANSYEACPSALRPLSRLAVIVRPEEGFLQGLGIGISAGVHEAGDPAADMSPRSTLRCTNRRSPIPSSGING